MEEIVYEFGFSNSSGGGGNYSDDHNLLAAEYFGWPPAFSDGAVPMESIGNVRRREVLSAANNSVLADNTCSNLQEDQKNNIQAKISSHPLFPKLLLSYIDSYKVGAPPEIVNMLDNIVQENDLHKRSSSSSATLNRPISVDDSELDDFMVSYCDVLAKFKSDLARSFNDATTFLNDVQTQLTNLCTTTNISGGEEAGDSIDGGGGEANNDDQEKSSSTDEMCRESTEIKDKLMVKYSGYITSLKQEFCNKNKKGKLPREATQILLNWWTTHYNWPYPTEGDKVCLAESTGLDPKQINNWFINQRKRHWKPSENMQFAVMETIYGHFSQ